MRPVSLAQVADLTLQGDSFDLCFANFLDEFYAHPNKEALIEEPAFLTRTFGETGQVEDAYFAAAAEELSRLYRFPLPKWTEAESRKLHRPWFASTLRSLRSVLVPESPSGFRSRNLFVSENALTKA